MKLNNLSHFFLFENGEFFFWLGKEGQEARPVVLKGGLEIQSRRIRWNDNGDYLLLMHTSRTD